MRNILLLSAVMVLTLGSMRPAVAVLPFFNVFAEQYLDTHPDKDFADAVKKPADRCFVCHQGKKRTNHNAFGQELAKLLDRREHARDVEKISEAIKQVLAMPVDPNDENSETYADRIAASQWPAGELDDLKQEPDEEAPVEETAAAR